MSSEHSPTPWSYAAALSGSENHKGFHIWAAGWGAIVQVYAVDEDGLTGKANADFIVRACNNFEALLEALKDIERNVGIYSISGLRAVAHAALAQAAGETA